MADFLIALADFDRCRAWERLGHASLFAFLRVELRLPNPSAFWRMSAVRALQRFPDLIEPLRDGRLCCSATAELAKVLTEENRAEVLPRFFGLSAREAQEVVAEMQPRQAPATRTVVTELARTAISPSLTIAEVPVPPAGAPTIPLHPEVVPPTQLRTPEVAFGGGAQTAGPRDDVEPLTADLRRLHITVDRQFMRMLELARDGLSHAMPGACTGDVLKAALELLLERQARARGLVKRPRTILAAAPVPPTPTPAPTTTTTTEPAPALEPFPTEPPPRRRTGPRQAIPAAVKRAVWERDRGRCVWPLDGGGECGSTHRLQLDHLEPWARWGGETVADLRVVCARHNHLAARQVFGERAMSRYSRRQRAGDHRPVRPATLPP